MHMAATPAQQALHFGHSDLAFWLWDKLFKFLLLPLSLLSLSLLLLLLLSLMHLSCDLGAFCISNFVHFAIADSGCNLSKYRDEP